MSAWVSLPQQWLMTTWNKQTSIILAQTSATVLSFEEKNIRALKKFVYKLLWFLLLKRLCCSTLHLFDLQIFLITMPQETRKGTCQGGTSMWASNRTLQANTPSVHCLQTNEKPRNKMGIHLGCNTTHGHAKLIPNWNPQFHQIFTSSASSKTKTDKEFSCLFTFHLDIEKNSLSTTTAN